MNNTYVWYSQLIKPEWAPASEVFGPVWAVLYVIIAISFGAVMVNVIRGTLPRMVAVPFILNLVFNLLFTPIQFGLQNNLLAAVDILLVLGTLVWGICAVWRHAKWIGMVNIPYVVWVAFATGLQLTITYLNW